MKILKPKWQFKPNVLLDHYLKIYDHKIALNSSHANQRFIAWCCENIICGWGWHFEGVGLNRKAYISFAYEKDAIEFELLLDYDYSYYLEQKGIETQYYPREDDIPHVGKLHTITTAKFKKRKN